MNLELNAESLPIEIIEVSKLLTCLGDPVNYRVLKGAASHVIAKTCITDM